jgi:hypothetical protein
LIDLLNYAQPLVVSNETIIIGFENEVIYNEFKKISLKTDILNFTKEIFDKEMALLPILEETWSKIGEMISSMDSEDKVSLANVKVNLFNLYKNENIDDIFEGKIEIKDD